jgi:hypothetical protein
MSATPQISHTAINRPDAENPQIPPKTLKSAKKAACIIDRYQDLIHAQAAQQLTHDAYNPLQRLSSLATTQSDPQSPKLTRSIRIGHNFHISQASPTLRPKFPSPEMPPLDLNGQ